MKRHGSLYAHILDFENLLLAARQAQRGKRFRPNVLHFNYNLEQELAQLKTELATQTYQPGHYRTFEIFEPKRRTISAAPYRDRVVHHALCNIIVPIFEPTFISDSYANRIGFGTHRALNRFTQFARSSQYVLQCDICQYFPSIDLDILKTAIRRKIKCPETLWLIDAIVDNSNTKNPIIQYFPGDTLLDPLNRNLGLPIGNLTSQFFANLYLNSFDHSIKQTFKIKKYIRYVDDFALFSDNREHLANARLAVEESLATLRLKIHPIKSQLFKTKYGANFLGFRIFNDKIRVRNYNLQKGRHRLRQLQQDCVNGNITQTRVHKSIQSWVAHLNYGDTWRLQQQIFADTQL